MVDAANDRRAPVQPFVRRIPVQISAFLLLAVCACAFVAIYLDISQTARGIVGAIGFGLFVMTLGCLRMYLEVDDEGVAVRYLLREQWVTWDQVERVEIASGVRGSESIRVVRKDGALIDVPPALIQPTAPTSRPKAMARLRGILGEIESRRPDVFRSPG